MKKLIILPSVRFLAWSATSQHPSMLAGKPSRLVRPGSSTLFPLLVLLPLFLLPGCEEMVTDVELPDYVSQPVVQCFLSPEETTASVFVSETYPVFGEFNYEGYTPLTGAQVTLSQGGQSVAIPWSDPTQGYSLPIGQIGTAPGTFHVLNVRLADGRNAQAECLIPERQNTSLQINGLTWQSTGYDSIGTLLFQFTDLPGEGDYYRVGALGVSRGEPGGDPWISPLELEKGEAYLSDKNKDGQTFSYRLTVYAWGMDTILVYLLTTDEAYYRYHKSLQDYNDDNPFGEPTLVYSNVDGGRGIFCAFRMHTLSVSLKNRKGLILSGPAPSKEIVMSAIQSHP